MVRRPLTAPQSHAPFALRAFWATLNEIPIGAISAAAALLGSAAIFIYLQSVGYVPTEMVSLLSAGLQAGVLMAIYFTAITVMMFAPVIVNHLFSEHAMSALETLSTTLMVIFGSLSIYGIQMYKGCLGQLEPWPIASAVVGLVGFCGVLQGAWKRMRTKSPTGSAHRYQLVVAYFAVTVLMALASIYLTTSLAEPAKALGEFADHSGWDSVAVLVLLLLILLANAVGVRRAMGMPQWAFGALVTVIAVHGPLLYLLDGQAGIPRKIAKAIGLRLEGPVELLVPQSTCQLIVAFNGRQATVPATPAASADSICKPTTRITAYVHVRTSSKWFIEPVEVGSSKFDGTRGTIPDAGTEILVRPPKRPNTAAITSACRP